MPTARAEARGGPAAEDRAVGADALVGRRLRLPGSDEVRFESTFEARAPIDLHDHRLFGIPVVPGACHFAMLARAAALRRPGATVSYERLFLLSPLTFPGERPRVVQLIERRSDEGSSIEIASAAADATAEDAWTRHVIAGIRAGPVPTGRGPTDWRAVVSGGAPLDGETFYGTLWANQGGTGRSFRWIRSVWRGHEEAVARAAPPPEAVPLDGCLVHPGLVEAACQLLHACLPIETREDIEQRGVTFVPFSVERLVVPAVAERRGAPSSAWCHARVRGTAPGTAGGDLVVMDDDGTELLRIEGFVLRPVSRETLAAATSGTTRRASADRADPAADPAARARPVAATRAQTDPVAYLRARIADSTGHPVERIAADRSPVALGVDSMAAVTLVNRIRRDFGAELDVAEVLTSPSIEALAARLGRAPRQ